MQEPRSSKGEMVRCDCGCFTSTIAAILHWGNACPFCYEPIKLTSQHGSFYRRHLVETERSAELETWEVLYVEFISAREAERVRCLFQRNPSCFPFPIGEIRRNHASHCLEFVVLPGQRPAECAGEIGDSLHTVTRATVDGRVLWKKEVERKAA